MRLLESVLIFPFYKNLYLRQRNLNDVVCALIYKSININCHGTMNPENDVRFALLSDERIRSASKSISSQLVTSDEISLNDAGRSASTRTEASLLSSFISTALQPSEGGRGTALYF